MKRLLCLPAVLALALALCPAAPAQTLPGAEPAAPFALAGAPPAQTVPAQTAPAQTAPAVPDAEASAPAADPTPPGYVVPSGSGYVYHIGGSFAPHYTGLGLYGTTWYYFVNGVYDPTVTDTLVQHINGWFYYLTDGRVDTGFTGLKLYGETWYYVRGGEVNPAEVLSGAVVRHVNGWYYYLNNSRIDRTRSGLVAGVDLTDPAAPGYGAVRLWYLVNGECNPAIGGTLVQNNRTWRLTGGRTDPVQMTPPAPLTEAQQQIFEAVNAQRAAAGQPALRYAGEFQSAADTRAAETTVQFSHTRPDGRPAATAVYDTDPALAQFDTDKGSHYYTLNGRNYRVGVGENIARSTDAAPDFAAVWMASPAHRANLLDSRYASAVVGLADADSARCAVLMLIAE